MYSKEIQLYVSVQFSSVTQSCPTHCNPMDCSTPGFPVHHQFPELAQTHVHWVGDAIQPSHPLLPPYPPAFNLSQHQGLAPFIPGGQNIGVSASASVLPMNIQGWFPFGWTSWISLLSKWLSRVFSNTTPQKHQFFGTQLSLESNSQHPRMTTGKTIALTRQTFLGKVMLLLFNMLSRLVVTFLPRSKHLLISWLQSPSAVILEPNIVISHCFHCLPIYLPWSNWTRCHDLSFLNVVCIHVICIHVSILFQIIFYSTNDYNLKGPHASVSCSSAFKAILLMTITRKSDSKQE